MLIQCPECGKEISDKAASCPSCGCPSSAWRTQGAFPADGVGSSTPAGKRCQFCGGNLVFQTVMEEVKPSFGTLVLYILLALTVFGIFIVIPLALRKKTVTKTYAVCQNCGKRFIPVQRNTA